MKLILWLLLTPLFQFEILSPVGFVFSQSIFFLCEKTNETNKGIFIYKRILSHTNWLIWWEVSVGFNLYDAVLKYLSSLTKPLWVLWYKHTRWNSPVWTHFQSRAKSVVVVVLCSSAFWETETILPFSKVKDDNLTFTMIHLSASPTAVSCGARRKGSFGCSTSLFFGGSV